jgi:hypothetical protein
MGKGHQVFLVLIIRLQYIISTRVLNRVVLIFLNPKLKLEKLEKLLILLQSHLQPINDRNFNHYGHYFTLSDAREV